VVSSLQAHPLKTLMDAGLCVTMNSDDPSFFGGYVNDNFNACQAALELDRAHILALARNSFQASFLPFEERVAALAAIDAYDRDAPAWSTGG
jgi:adenosine deaminase